MDNLASSTNSMHALQTQQFDLQDTYATDTFSNLGEGTFSTLPNESSQVLNQECGKKTNKLIGEYHNLLSDMRSQINHIKGKFGAGTTTSTIDSSLSGAQQQRQLQQSTVRESQVEYCPYDQVEQEEEDHQKVVVKQNSPHMKIEEIYTSRVQPPSHPQQSYQYQSQMNILRGSQQQYPSMRQSEEMSPNDMINRNYISSTGQGAQHENGQRRVLSTINLKQQNQDPSLVMSQYKFTHSQYASPTIEKPLTQSVQQLQLSNKENMNANSPQGINLPKFEAESQYHEQVRLNRQLIEQIKDLKLKQLQMQQKCQQEAEVKIIKLIQNEEYLMDKCQNLENDNQGLQHQLHSLSYQVEGSLRNNQDLESYLENYEVSTQQFNEKQKYFNKKIQDLIRKNTEYKQQNQDMDAKIKQLEQDKAKLSEKWIRMSARIKVEEKSKQKIIENQTKKEQINKELELCKQKIDVIERENSYLKEQNDKYKQKCQMQQTVVKEIQTKLEGTENDKHLADKVTNKLLQRIQRYEEDIKSLQEGNQQKDQQQCQEYEQEIMSLQSQIQQMNQDLSNIQAYNGDLEVDNGRLVQELQQYIQQEELKDQQIENLQLQISHQTEQFKELQAEFEYMAEQMVKQSSNFLIKFSSQELNNETEYLIGQIQSIQNGDQNQDEDLQEQNNEEYALQSLVIQASKKIRFMNKYMDGLKQELEETSLKYDKLALKYRDLLKSYEQIGNIKDVTIAQKDTLNHEMKEQKQYIAELEQILQQNDTIIQTNHMYKSIQDDVDNYQSHNNNNKQLTQQRGQNISIGNGSMYKYASQQNFEGVNYQGSIDNYENQVSSYQTLPNTASNIMSDSKNSQLYGSRRDLQQHQQYTQPSYNPLNPLMTNKINGSLRTSHDHNNKDLVNYDHSKVCLPTRLLGLQNQQKSIAQAQAIQSHNQSMEITHDHHPQQQVTLQDQIKNQLQHTKNSYSNKQQPGNPKYIRKNSRDSFSQRKNSQPNNKSQLNKGVSQQQTFWSQRTNGNLNEAGAGSSFNGNSKHMNSMQALHGQSNSRQFAAQRNQSCSLLPFNII